jgi:hypothetical protein
MIGDGAADSGGLSEPDAPLTLTALLGTEWLAGQELAPQSPHTAPTATILQELAPQTTDAPQELAPQELAPQAADTPQESASQEEREEWCYRMKQAGWSYPQMGKAMSRSADSARRYAQAHAKRHGLELK